MRTPNTGRVVQHLRILADVLERGADWSGNFDMSFEPEYVEATTLGGPPPRTPVLTRVQIDIAIRPAPKPIARKRPARIKTK